MLNLKIGVSCQYYDGYMTPLRIRTRTLLWLNSYLADVMSDVSYHTSILSTRIIAQKSEKYLSLKNISYLDIIHTAGNGKVNAEYDDKNEEADQEKQPVLPPKFHTWSQRKKM